jgi:hypothetical protein
LTNLSCHVVENHLAAVQAARAEQTAAEAARKEADEVLGQLTAALAKLYDAVESSIGRAAREAQAAVRRDLNLRMGGFQERAKLAVEKVASEFAGEWATVAAAQEKLEIGWIGLLRDLTRELIGDPAPPKVSQSVMPSAIGFDPQGVKPSEYVKPSK